MEKTINCPVDFIKVNETQVRITALQVLLITIAWIFFGNIALMALLIPDFFLRSFNLGRYSLLNMVSKFFATTLGLPQKPVDRAPKRFAAKIGLFFVTGITLLQLLDFNTAAVASAGVLIVFAFLESAIGFCAGCYCYTFYKKLFLKETAA